MQTFHTQTFDIQIFHCYCVILSQNFVSHVVVTEYNVHNLCSDDVVLLYDGIVKVYIKM